MKCKFGPNFKNGIAGWYFEDDEIQNASNNSNILMLDIEFGTNCSLNCGYCFRKNDTSRDRKSHDSRDLNYNKLTDLSANDIFDIIGQAKDMGAKSIHFVGKGESLEHENFLDILRYIFKENMIPLIFTAGHVLGDDDIANDYQSTDGKSIIRDLYNTNTSVILKINSFNAEIQNKIVETSHVKHKDGTESSFNYTKVRNNALEELINRGFNNKQLNPTRLGTATVILDSNYDELFYQYQLFRCLNIYPIINTVVPCGRTQNMAIVKEINPSEIEKYELWKKIYTFNIDNGIPFEGISSYAGGHICSQLGYAMYVNVFGEVFDCPSSTRGSLGNVKSNGKPGEKLKDLWNKSDFRVHYNNCRDNGCPWRMAKTEMIPTDLFKITYNYLKEKYVENEEIQNYKIPDYY